MDIWGGGWESGAKRITGDFWVPEGLVFFRFLCFFSSNHRPECCASGRPPAPAIQDGNPVFVPKMGRKGSFLPRRREEGRANRTRPSFHRCCITQQFFAFQHPLSPSLSLRVEYSSFLS